jgi:hypothetical protein
MLHRRHRFQPTIIGIVASTALACMGSVALASASQAAAVTFNYTGADVSYTINPGTYRISVFGAQGGSTAGSVGVTDGGLGAWGFRNLSDRANSRSADRRGGHSSWE